MKNQTLFSRLTKVAVLAGLCFTMTPMDLHAQNGPITSRLKRVLLYFYNYGTDHTNTPAYINYIRALGTANGFTVDSTRSQAVFSQTNLANYDVLFLFSAYYFGRAMSASQKTAVEGWYSQSKGIACFHQCVRNEWGGTAPNWYDNLMGAPYATYAGFGVGPVFVDPAVAGTDLAMNRNKEAYPANYRITWDDEWYTYSANPAVLPNTKKILTTRRTGGHVGTRNWNASQGEEITMAWSREVQGGRFVLSSFFHTDQPRTSTVDSLRQFIDGHYLGVMRYLAGYDGCKDSTSLNYNPKATHNDPAVCAGSTTIKISTDNAYNAIRIGRFQVSIAEQGRHSVEVFNSSGAKTASYAGTGPKEYDFSGIRQPGVYFVKARTNTGSVSKKILLL